MYESSPMAKHDKSRKSSGILKPNLDSTVDCVVWIPRHRIFALKVLPDSGMYYQLQHILAIDQRR